MNSTIRWLSLLLVVSAARAQTFNATYTNPTAMAAYAFRTSPQRVQIPANTDLRKGASATTTIFGPKASVAVTFSQTGPRVTIGIRDRSSAFWESRYRNKAYTGACGNASSACAHTTLLTLTAPKAMAGRLVVSWQPTARGQGSGIAGWGWVDIGADNSNEFQGAHTAARTQTFPVQVGPGGLKILTRTLTRAEPNAFDKNPFVSTALTVQWLPNASPCVIRGYGETCGPTLGGYHTVEDNLELRLFNAVPKSLGIVFVGTQTLSIRLPGTLCKIHTEPALLLPIQVDGIGMGQTRLTLGFLRPLAFNVQAATVSSPLVLQLSNGLSVRCK